MAKAGGKGARKGEGAARGAAGGRGRDRDAFPFPGHAAALQELCLDPVYPRIPAQDRGRVAAAAWEKGARAARQTFAREGGSYVFERICVGRGLAVVRRDIDCVHGDQRYFSDYVAGRSEITLYERSCALWAQQNGMDLARAENLILSHEFFHFLEWTELGLTSREYQVPMVAIGRLRLGKTGVRALSEIGAHGFARTYHELFAAARARTDETEGTGKA